MVYTVEFYGSMRDEVLTKVIEAPDRNLAVDGIRRYYRASLVAIRSVKETPDAKPMFEITRIPRISI